MCEASCCAAGKPPAIWGNTAGRSSLIGSISASRPCPRRAAYCAAKAAAHAYAQSVALEWAPMGIRVNVVAPGPIDTEFLDSALPTSDEKEALTRLVPLGRIGTPRDVFRRRRLPAQRRRRLRNRRRARNRWRPSMGVARPTVAAKEHGQAHKLLADAYWGWGWGNMCAHSGTKDSTKRTVCPNHKTT